MEKRKKLKKKINFKRTLIFMLFIYIMFFSIYCIINQPIRHIEISGNNLVSDKEIIELSKLKNYPPIYKYSINKIKNNIETLDLIDSVDVKKKIGFIVKIKIKENIPLFYYLSENKLVLSNGNIIKNNNKIIGIPTLMTTINSKILSSFTESFKMIKEEIKYEMSEISYTPKLDINGNVIDEQFTILMNDGNTIITTSKKCSLINKYNEIFASLNGKLGTLYLSSGTIDNLIFIPYGG